MRKISVVAIVVVVLGLLVVPAFAFGGFGMGRGMTGNGVGTTNASLTEAEHNQWLDEQVENGWMTQKQADYMKERFSKRLTGYTEEEYFAWIDQQVNDGWMTVKQADYMKEMYKLNKDRFGDNAPFMMGRGGYGCSYANQDGAVGFGGMMGGRGMRARGGRW